MKMTWLIEHPPVSSFGPIYVPEKSGHLTFDPWAAKRFNSKEEAEQFMTKPDYIPFRSPWHAVSHGFDED